MKFRRSAWFTALSVLAVLTALVWLAPLPTGLKLAPRQSVEFVDRTGKPLRRILEDQRVYRMRCKLGEISPNAIAATLSAEDKRFRTHCGIDLVAVIRALRDAIRTGRIHSGASTITEQLVKLASTDQKRGFLQKITEIWGALCVERHWSKDRILEEYLNRLDYGDLQVGLASASVDYFEKPPSDLSAAEAAFLAAIPKAPSRLDPFTHFAAPGAPTLGAATDARKRFSR